MANVFSNIVTRHPLTKDGVYEWDFAVSGYFFFKITKVPEMLNIDDLTQLQALCTGVTLPDVNINVSDRVGLGGVKVGVVTSLDMGNTLTVKFVEIVPEDGSVPVLYHLAKWQNAVRNYITGVADATYASSMNDYKGHAVFLATDPTVTKVVLALRFWGLFPTTVPYSGYTADVATNDFIEYDVTFHVDRCWPVVGDDSEVNAYLSELKSWIDANNIQVPQAL